MMELIIKQNIIDPPNMYYIYHNSFGLTDICSSAVQICSSAHLESVHFIADESPFLLGRFTERQAGASQ